MKNILKIVVDKYTTLEISQHEISRKSVCVFAGDMGWVLQFEQHESMFEILNHQVNYLKCKLLNATHSKRNLNQLLIEVKKEINNQSQLTIFQ